MSEQRAVAAALATVMTIISGLIAVACIVGWLRNPYSNVERLWQQVGSVFFGLICLACAASARTLRKRPSPAKGWPSPWMPLIAVFGLIVSVVLALGLAEGRRASRNTSPPPGMVPPTTVVFPSTTIAGTQPVPPPPPPPPPTTGR